jgi:hypothetical protein
MLREGVLTTLVHTLVRPHIRLERACAVVILSTTLPFPPHVLGLRS